MYGSIQTSAAMMAETQINQIIQAPLHGYLRKYRKGVPPHKTETIARTVMRQQVPTKILTGVYPGTVFRGPRT
jgi:hypothetical protein